jgi:tRNA pseudouridine65 synthase
VLYEDSWLIAINKPSGQLVHRSALDPHATEFAVQTVRDLTGRHVFPVHRLDRPTSGVLLFTFEPSMITEMQTIWDTRVGKKYQSLVRGWVQGSGYIDYPLVYLRDKRTESDKRADNIQPAASSYQCLRQFSAPFKTARYSTARYSLIELMLHTGRKHQLRRHMAHFRHPIIGDTTHGDGKQNALARQHLGCQHLLLSCTEISFEHPLTKQHVVITSPQSENFESCLARLNNQQFLSLE